MALPATPEAALQAAVQAAVQAVLQRAMPEAPQAVMQAAMQAALQAALQAGRFVFLPLYNHGNLFLSFLPSISHHSNPSPSLNHKRTTK